MSGSFPLVSVIEHGHTGHRLFFAVLLANGLAAAGYRTQLITSATASQSPQFAEYGTRLDSAVNLCVDVTQPDLKASVETYAEQSRWAIALDGEALIYQRGLPAMRRNVIALVLHSPDLYPLRPGFKRMAKSSLLRRAQRRGILTVSLASPSVVLARRPNTVPDPSPFSLLSPDLAHEEPRLPGGTEWIGIFGGMTARKGSMALLRAVAASGRRDLGVSMIGPWTDPADKAQAINFATAGSIPLRLRDSYVSTEQLRQEMLAVDAVAVLNSNEGSSGVFLGSCSLDLPVLAAGSESLRRDAHATGVTWVSGDPQGLASVLAGRALRSLPSPSYRPAPHGEDFVEPFVRLMHSDL